MVRLTGKQPLAQEAFETFLSPRDFAAGQAGTAGLMRPPCTLSRATCGNQPGSSASTQETVGGYFLTVVWGCSSLLFVSLLLLRHLCVGAPAVHVPPRLQRLDFTLGAREKCHVVQPENQLLSSSNTPTATGLWASPTIRAGGTLELFVIHVNGCWWHLLCPKYWGSACGLPLHGEASPPESFPDAASLPHLHPGPCWTACQLLSECSTHLDPPSAWKAGFWWFPRHRCEQLACLLRNA